jgi:hypothetical protein
MTFFTPEILEELQVREEEMNRKAEEQIEVKSMHELKSTLVGKKQKAIAI